MLKKYYEVLVILRAKQARVGTTAASHPTRTPRIQLVHKKKRLTIRVSRSDGGECSTLFAAHAAQKKPDRAQRSVSKALSYEKYAARRGPPKTAS